MGNSVSKDTTPDLTFAKNLGSQSANWHNTGTDLGSDHMIIEIEIPLPGKHQGEKRKLRWTDWNDFRKTKDSRGEEEITDIEAWC